MPINVDFYGPRFNMQLQEAFLSMNLPFQEHLFEEHRSRRRILKNVQLENKTKNGSNVKCNL